MSKNTNDLGSALAFRTIGRIFENSRKRSLSTFIRHRWHRRVDRYGETDRGGSKPRNQRWIDFWRSTHGRQEPSRAPGHAYFAQAKA